MVFGDTAFKEVLLLLDVHHLRQPREWVLHILVERLEAYTFEAAIRNKIDETCEKLTLRAHILKFESTFKNPMKSNIVTDVYSL